MVGSPFPLASQPSLHLPHLLPIASPTRSSLYHPSPSPVPSPSPIPSPSPLSSPTPLPVPLSLPCPTWFPPEPSPRREEGNTERVWEHAGDMGTTSERWIQGSKEHSKSLKSLPPCLVARS